MTTKRLLSSSASFIILTGLSGAGKSQAIRALEDLGYFCVDNLPVSLLQAFADGVESGGGATQPSAVVADVRDPRFLREFPTILSELKTRTGLGARVIFLEATDEALVRRFSETRRPHPLAPDRSVTEGIIEERKRLSGIRGTADYVFDTSKLTVHELRKTFMGLSVEESSSDLVVTVLSFGYKYGVPLESDVMFDLRFLRNPHFEPSLRELTGQNSEVQKYLESLEPTRAFLTKTTDLLNFLVPQYKAEGKKYLTIGIGCTGGRHRSVYIAEQLAARIGLGDGASLRVHHRDLEKL
ncbi:MAG: RNase adapter RapZ [Acidobacteriota bacterium]|nr:RNase adapter RapZ [Acidobacteriota bacterium]